MAAVLSNCRWLSSASALAALLNDFSLYTSHSVLSLPKTPSALHLLHLRSLSDTLRSRDYSTSRRRFGERSGDDEIYLSALSSHSLGRTCFDTCSTAGWDLRGGGQHARPARHHGHRRCVLAGGREPAAAGRQCKKLSQAHFSPSLRHDRALESVLGLGYRSV